jgi:hypothetical protein
MAAAVTVSQLSRGLNSSDDSVQSLAPSRGVLTLFGHGIVVKIERGSSAH